MKSGSSTHTPSKLSNSIPAPLTPTIEEGSTPETKTPGSRDVSSAGGFFSSVFSAAQNAATNLSTSFNAQNKRGASSSSESELQKTHNPVVENPSAGDLATSTPDQKKLAVETLGMGDLSLSHLGIEPAASDSTTKDGAMTSTLTKQRSVSSLRQDEVAANNEDVHAARAVSAAYSKATDDTVTPVAEDHVTNHAHRPSSTFGSLGAQTPPNGSIYEGDPGSGGIKRSGSVRSRLAAARRHRGSSGATMGTAIGGLIGASTSTLAQPAAGPRLTGFAVANKKRNRDFHQLFRSVPEDDYLIEDYSCALQRDIILAGRIYISEGHICFSSNILGWVTTLVMSFDEIVSVEKESTAMVFPNAIAIQTLHARHTFRSLLSREATYDLIIGIWKINHPNLKSSVNGMKTEGGGTGDKTEKAEESEGGSAVGSEEDEEVYDEDEDEGDEGDGSFTEAAEGSIAGSELTDPMVKAVSRKASQNGVTPTQAVVPYPQFSGDQKGGEKAGVVGAAASVDFPGPATHAPTECADQSSHYEKVVKDETIPAPLGKIYSMVFGPASGVFMTRYLNDDQKSLELQLEDDKKGLDNENKTRQYSYIKPLYGSIGPKQTKCITTETLDALDLERAVSVTVTTQTPDVPSGNAFSTKTKYCLSWGPGNSTRIQMNCTIEWTAKSWLKGISAHRSYYSLLLT